MNSMKLRFLLCAILMFGAVWVSGSPIRLEAPLKVGATTYSNVTVVGFNATDLYLTHDHGISNVKLKYLSPSCKSGSITIPKRPPRPSGSRNSKTLFIKL